MPGRGAGWVLATLLLAGCEHSPPFTAALDRPTGPLDPGPPTRLTADTMPIVGFTWDDKALIVIGPRRPLVRSPDGKIRRDSVERCLGLIPSTGGSRFWEYCDDRPSQHDSANHVYSADIAPDGRLLMVQTTAPIFTDTTPRFPLMHHAELWLSDTAKPGVNRRMLLQLYDDEVGRPVVPPGTINWLERVTWIGSDRFVALASHLTPSPDPPRQFLGMVVGQITADTTILRPLDDMQGVESWSATPEGDLVFVIGARLWMRPTSEAAERELLAELPLPAGHHIASARCHGGSCWAISRPAVANQIVDWQLWRTRDGVVEEPVLVRHPSPPGIPRLSHRGRDVLVRFQKREYLIPALLPHD